MRIIKGVSTRRVFVAVGLAFSIAVTSGCGLPFFGDRVEVADESPALTAAYRRVLDAKATAHLGDIITESGIPVGKWDRMYSFDSPNSKKELNAALGTNGLNWSGLPQDSDSTTQVFVHNGKVVYAFDDKQPRYGVRNGRFATPDSVVEAKLEPRGQGTNDMVWLLTIQAFS